MHRVFSLPSSSIPFRSVFPTHPVAAYASILAGVAHTDFRNFHKVVTHTVSHYLQAVINHAQRRVVNRHKVQDGVAIVRDKAQCLLGSISHVSTLTRSGKGFVYTVALSVNISCLEGEQSVLARLHSMQSQHIVNTRAVSSRESPRVNFVLHNDNRVGGGFITRCRTLLFGAASRKHSHEGTE